MTVKCNLAMISSKSYLLTPQFADINREDQDKKSGAYVNRSKGHWNFDKQLIEEFICSLLVELSE